MMTEKNDMTGRKAVRIGRLFVRSSCFYKPCSPAFSIALRSIVDNRREECKICKRDITKSSTINKQELYYELIIDPTGLRSALPFESFRIYDEQATFRSPQTDRPNRAPTKLGTHLQWRSVGTHLQWRS